MINGIEHIAICAKDTSALCKWYVETFNFSVVFDNGEGVYFIRANDGTVFEIMKFKSGVQPWDTSAIGLRHIALSVSKDDFDYEVNRIKSMGLKIEADVSEAPNGVKTFFFRDPEGNLLHFIYRPVSL
ncbi:MAG: VOC family protein [Clostridia bacterium]|nr:VOC family protein [Clostridia bacterium]